MIPIDDTANLLLVCLDNPVPGGEIDILQCIRGEVSSIGAGLVHFMESDPLAAQVVIESVIVYCQRNSIRCEINP